MSGSQSKSFIKTPAGHCRGHIDLDHQNKFWIGAAMAVPEYLPGRPTKRLDKLVRLILRNYGIAVEISTQYILLLLAEIKATDV